MYRTKAAMMLLIITLIIVVCHLLINKEGQSHSIGLKPFAPMVFRHRGFYSHQDNANKVQHCTVLNLTQPPSSNNIKCAKMNIVKPFAIMCHSHKVSNHVANYELGEVTFVMETLQKNPEMGLIDIGSNLGLYSLPVAMMGHKVVSVEPNPANYLHFHESVYLQRLQDKVTLVTNPIGGPRTLMTILQDPVMINPRTRMRTINQPCNHTLNATHVCSVTLSDLLEVISFDSAIMKMDCQGYEVQAMRNAAPLLDKVRIPYIQMEWVFMPINPRLRSDGTNDTEHVRLVNNLIKFLVGRNYTPYGGARSKVPLKTSSWMRWKYVNVWWKLKEG